MSPEELREHLWKLPPDERCAMLILSCVELDQNALGRRVERRWRCFAHGPASRAAPAQRVGGKYAFGCTPA
jgi:hypothetical protein